MRHLRCTLTQATVGDGLQLVRPDKHTYPIVIGEVNLVGWYLPADFGYRAQYAYPKRLYVPYECWEMALPLRDNYGVPAQLSNTFKP